MTKVLDYQQEKSNERNVVKNNLVFEETNGSCRTANWLGFCAWLFLTLGVCIIFTIFFHAAIHKSDYSSATKLGGGNVAENRANVMLFNNDETDLLGTQQFRLEANKIDFNKTAKSSLYNLYNKMGKNLNRCKEDFCQIACANVADIYTALHDTMMKSSCFSIDVLVLEKQNFPLGILNNNWLPVNISLNELIIRFTKRTTIKRYAFNTPLFRGTLLLTLYNRFNTIIESEALLGFHSLKYLTIQSYLTEFQSSILQPVENTLLSFKLNGNLKINGTKNVFAESHLNNLTYLDLSHNILTDSLGKMLFATTPNLKYLILCESRIQHIEKDAFVYLADKLLFVNLSKNRLTTLAAEVFAPVLMGQLKAVIDLEQNNLICDCLLQNFAKFYKTYNLQFMPALYCKGPHRLYGTSLDQVDFSLENCYHLEKSEQNLKANIESTTLRGELTATKQQQSTLNIKMRCSDVDQSPTEAQQSGTFKRQARSVNDRGGHLEFPPPDHEFDLVLIEKNNSAVVTIEGPLENYLVIWFAGGGEQNSSSLSKDNTNLNYECVRYAEPQLIVGPLQANTTYTFCVISAVKNNISPFNCLPLKVPAKADQNLWISEDRKYFTIGILFLIFLLSTIAGSVIAYFGLKAYPDLLEGSKHILIVKNNFQEDYITTISETEYQKQSSRRKHNRNKSPLLEILPQHSTPIPYCISMKGLQSISNVKSSAACLGDTPPSYSFIANGYEIPKICNDEYAMDKEIVENMYCATPKYPPPLPKRNSNTSNDSTLK